MKIISSITLILVTSLAFNASAEPTGIRVADAVIAGAAASIRVPSETAHDLAATLVDLFKRHVYLVIDRIVLPLDTIAQHTREVHNYYSAGDGKTYLSSLAAYEKAAFALTNSAMVIIPGILLARKVSALRRMPDLLRIPSRAFILSAMLPLLAPAIGAYSNVKI
jgi:hypothetical protein